MLACALWLLHGWAAAPANANNGNDEAPPNENAIERLENWHGRMSDRIAAYATHADRFLYLRLGGPTRDEAPPANLSEKTDRLDDFFGEPGIALRRNKSRIKVSPNLQIKDKEGFSPAMDFSANLDLPLAQKRTHIFFDNQMERMTRSAPVGDHLPDRDKESVIGLFFDMHRTERLRTHLQLGVRRIVFPYAKYAIEYAWEANDWLIIPSQEFYYRAGTGPGESTGLEFSREIKPDTYLRVSQVGTWAADSKGYEFGQYIALIALRQAALDSTGFVLETGYNGYISSMTAIDNYAVSFRYRRPFWREWLYFELNPRVDFPRKYDYRTTASVKITIEIIFERLP